MKKLHLTVAAILFAFTLFSCSNSDLPTNSDAAEKNPADPIRKNVSVPANPVIAYFSVETVNKVSGVTCLNVINEDGTNKTRLFISNLSSSRQYSRPIWSPSGTSSICYGEKGSSGTNALYRCDINVINNIPVAINKLKLWDGGTTYTSYDRAWNPIASANEIAISVCKTSTNVNTIQLVNATSGGTPVTIYTAPAVHTINIITYSPDGNYLAVVKRGADGNKIMILDHTNGQVVKEIDVSQFIGIITMDWQRSPNSSVIEFEVLTTATNHSIYNIDINSNNPPVLIMNSTADNRQGSFSPDDSKLLYWNQYKSGSTWVSGLRIYNFSTNTSTPILTSGEWASWKR
ncbi:MAG: hypothetical protein WCT77_14785 [Bacteroidota bacterium]